ncbi:MAG: MoaD/ThiS family protein [Desulfobacteraceae bacterium]|nr:MoaD/ThiS family protein [Desulfobacteraceae bacterium]
MICVQDQRLAWHPGMTLDQVLDALEKGHLYAVVRVNGKLISKPFFAVTKVPDESIIEPLPLIAGG